MRGWVMVLALTVWVYGCTAVEEKSARTPLAEETPAGPRAVAEAANLQGQGGRGGAPATRPGEAGGEASATVGRLIVYNGGLQMVVAEIAPAERTIQSLCASAGGYLEELDGNTISVRVPAAKFEEVMGAIERLGEVTGRHVKANDVTDQMRDLKIRLENAEAVRQRLEEILAKSVKMEDTLKVEQELERVTETIELLKGKLQYMEQQVAFSTIEVSLNSPRPAGEPKAATPFEWVKALGDGAVAGVTEAAPDTDRFWKRNERFALPAGFIRYYEKDHVTEAMSAENVIIRLQREENYDGGELAFWSRLARRSVTENRAIAVLREEDVKLKDGTAGQVLVGNKDLGAKKEGYLLGIVATKHYVYAFEAWGEKEQMGREEQALVAAFGTLEVKQ